jgi:hypothetical protein
MAEDIVMNDAEFWVVGLKEQCGDDGGVSHVIEADAKIIEGIRGHASTEGHTSTFDMSDEALKLGTVCSHGSFSLSLVLNGDFEIVPFSEHNAVGDGEMSRDDPPSEICTYCWKTVYDQKAARSEQNSVNYSEDDGFRFKFKWRGDPRNVWADVVVGYNVSFETLSGTLKNQFRFDTIGHVAMWGLGEEYFDSQAAVLDLDRFEQSRASPSGLGGSEQHQYSRSETTVGDFLSEYNIDVRDRICYAWDLGTPHGIYGILKETGVGVDSDAITIASSEGSISFDHLY